MEIQYGKYLETTPNRQKINFRSLRGGQLSDDNVSTSQIWLVYKLRFYGTIDMLSSDVGAPKKYESCVLIPPRRRVGLLIRILMEKPSAPALPTLAIFLIPRTIVV